MIFCCMVVWICHDQATVTVPQALEHLTTVVPQDTENLNLCKIPTDAPFWPSLPSDDESYLITLSSDDTESLFGRPSQAFHAYRGIMYCRASSFRTFMALNKTVSRKADIQTDEAAFYYIKPREALWVNDLYVTVGEDDQNIPAVNTLYLVGPDSILPNPVLELNPTIASVATATFEDKPTADAQAVKVAEHIIMVGKKQFDMMMGGDQESDSASSLTIAITNIKIKPPNQGTIMEDANAPQLPEGTEDATDMTTPGPVANEEETPSANDGTSAMVPMAAGDPDAQTTQLKPANMQVNPNHMSFLLNLPCTLTDQSSILDDAYAAIMDTFFLHILVRHAESLRDLNTCRAAVNKAVQTWTDTVSWQTRSLRSFPRVSSYNQAVDNLCLCSQALRWEINHTEKEYLDKRDKHTEKVGKTKKAWKDTVQAGVGQAIHYYLQATGRAILLHLGPNGNHAPWLAQVTTQACDFQSWIMSAVADYSDIPIKLRCAAVLQQQDMFLSTTQTLPWTCPLSYPVLAQHICLEAKVPPTPTHMSKDGSKSSDGPQPLGGSVQSSSIRQSVAHSLPGMRQPTGTVVLAARASVPQTQLTSALRQGYSYGGMRSQPASRSDMPVPIEAMSFGAPAPQPSRFYSSLPQVSTW